MAIKVEFYGNLKEFFGSSKLIQYECLKKKTVYEVINKATENYNLFESKKDILNQVIILKNERKIHSLNIINEEVEDFDHLKVYLAVSGG